MAATWERLAYHDETVLKSLFDANTILAADTNDTPAALTVAEDRIVGRITGGNIDDLTPAQARTIENLNYPLSPMVLTGGEISDGGSGEAAISDVTAFLRSTDAANGVLTEVSLAGIANQSLDAADTKYKIILQYGSPCTIVVQAGKPNGTTQITLGLVMKDGSDVVHFSNSGSRLTNGVAKLHIRARKLRQNELASGCTITDSGSRAFAIAAGFVFEGINELNPFVGGAFGSVADKFTAVSYIDGAWVFTADQTAISDRQYNDMSSPGSEALANITNNQYACYWVYLYPGDEHVYVLYGQSSSKLAEITLEQPPGTLPTLLSGFAVLLGCIIKQEQTDTFTSIQMVTDTVFSGTAVATHDDLSGLNDGDYVHLTAAEYAAGAFNLHYVPIATSGDYTIPTATAFVGGDEYTVEGANTLTIEGTGRMVLLG